jgi:hypothetical protein
MKVEEMKTAETQQAHTPKRKAVLSPELQEFLHMLKSLEGEFGTQTPVAR